MDKRIIGILYTLVAAVCFGVMPILAKLAYGGGASTYSVLFLRFLFASIILLCYLLYKKISLVLTKKQYVMVILFAMFGFSACSVCLFSAYRHISVGLASMILYTYPAIVTLLCIVIYKEKLYWQKVVCLTLSLVGMYCLVGVKNEHYNVIGIALAFASALLYSFYIMGISDREIKKINPFVLTFYVSVCSCVTMFILGMGSNTLTFRVSAFSLVCILLLAFISTVVALMAFMQGVRFIGASKAAILSTLEPIVSLVLGIIILGEKLTLQVGVGSIFVISSVIIVSMEKQNK